MKLGEYNLKSLLYLIVTLLSLSACSEQESTKDQVLADSHNMLKYMCENRQPCLDQLEHAAVACKSQTAPDNFPASINHRSACSSSRWVSNVSF